MIYLATMTYISWFLAIAVVTHAAAMAVIGVPLKKWYYHNNGVWSLYTVPQAISCAPLGVVLLAAIWVVAYAKDPARAKSMFGDIRSQVIENSR